VRLKLETIQKVWAIARTEELHDAAFAFVRSIPPGVLGVKPIKLEADVDRLKQLAQINQAKAFTQEELDRLLRFFRAPVGQKYARTAVRWIQELDYNKTKPAESSNARELTNIDNYTCNK
jgi:Uncharacterized protein conserved in bacteria (DUF2059)